MSFVLERGTVDIFIKSGNNLPALDFNGKSDPFVKITVGNTTQSTKVIYKTLSPTWNENFKFNVTPNDRFINIKAYDWDLLTTNDYMGEITIDLTTLKKGKNIFDKNLSKYNGTLQFEVTPIGFIHLSVLRSLKMTNLSNGKSEHDLTSIFHVLKVEPDPIFGLFITIRACNDKSLHFIKKFGREDTFLAHNPNGKETDYKLTLNYKEKTFELRNEIEKFAWEGLIDE